MHWLSPFYYMEAEFGPLEKKSIKTIDISPDEIFRRTAGYTLFDHKRREEFFKALQVEPFDEDLRKYKSNWLRRVTIMNSNRVPKIMPNYGPDGRRGLGRPLKRILDEAETGLPSFLVGAIPLCFIKITVY